MSEGRAARSNGYGGHVLMQTPTTLATVTFEGDLRLTILQALSIDRLFNLDEVSEYVVVLNGSDNGALGREFKRHLDGRVSERLRARLRVVPAPQLPKTGDGLGWYGQQVVKLALADIVSTDTYLMLDAKNHFVRPSSIGDFFYDGLPSTVFSSTPPNWEKYVRASLEALDVYTDARAARMMPTTTPYVMITREVASLVDRIEAKYGRPLAQAIHETGGATEFFLYYAHLVSTHDEIPYSDRPSTSRTLFTSWPQDPAMVLSIIADTIAKDVPTFGLHRRRLPQLTDEQKDAIREMWRRHLLADWEDADWFMTYQ